MFFRNGMTYCRIYFHLGSNTWVGPIFCDKFLPTIDFNSFWKSFSAKLTESKTSFVSFLSLLPSIAYFFSFFSCRLSYSLIFLKGLRGLSDIYGSKISSFYRKFGYSGSWTTAWGSSSSMNSSFSQRESNSNLLGLSRLKVLLKGCSWETLFRERFSWSFRWLIFKILYNYHLRKV